MFVIGRRWDFVSRELPSPASYAETSKDSAPSCLLAAYSNIKMQNDSAGLRPKNMIQITPVEVGHETLT